MFYCVVQFGLSNLSIRTYQESTIYENDYLHTWEYHVLVKFLLVAEMAQREQ